MGFEMSIWKILFGKKGKTSTKAVARGASKTSDRPIVRETLEPKISADHLPLIQWREGSFPVDVKGESNYQENLISICGEYRRDSSEFRTEAVLVREPTNPYDPNAIQVKIDGLLVGYVARAQAEKLSEEFAFHKISEARAKAKIRGGWRTNQHDVGAYGVKLSIPRMGYVNFGPNFQKRVKPKGANQEGKESFAATSPVASKTGKLLGFRVFILGQRRDGPIATTIASEGAKVVAAVGKTTNFVIVDYAEPFPKSVRLSSQYKSALEQQKERKDLQIQSWDTFKNTHGLA